MSITGKIHSIESCGTVDGPGLRYILFTQGCPLRCQYCHNPDTWNVNDGKEMDTDELIADIVKYKSFMRYSKGGVTISGGEPLLQPDFIKDLFIKCKAENIHTALDTSGFIFNDKSKEVLEYTDLVLLDIKSYDAAKYKEITSVSLAPTIDFAKYLSSHNIKMWVRYVLVPGLSDNEEHITNLAKFLASLNSVEKVEVLPFHKMGEYKWEEIGADYKLKNTIEPSDTQVNSAVEIFKSHGLPCDNLI